MNALAAGDTLGAYRIVRLLGQGGMGCVYEAEHVGLRARRALKVFSAESEHVAFLRKRFVAEGRILADLDHPRIVRVYDFEIDVASGAPYFAMDLVLASDGEPRTLEDACRGGGIDEERVAGWFRDICEGLAYIHAKGVVHRDVSLDNILVDSDGRAVIADFGIARITGGEYRRRFDITQTMVSKDGGGFSMGKGLYLSPELRAGGEATPASDAYALGVLLFRLLEGSWYTSETRLGDALAGLDSNWDEVIGRLCAADPAVRLGPEGIAGIAKMLRSSDAEPLQAPRRGMWLRLVLAAAAGASAVAATVLLTHRGGGDAIAVGSAPAVATSEIIHITDVPRIVEKTNVVEVTKKIYQLQTITVTNRIDVPTAR